MEIAYTIAYEIAYKIAYEIWLNWLPLQAQLAPESLQNYSNTLGCYQL